MPAGVWGARLELGQRGTRRARVGLQQADENGEIALKPFQRAIVKPRERFWQHSGKRTRRTAQHAPPCGQHSKLDRPSVCPAACRLDQARGQQRLDQIAGGSLMDIHCARQSADSNARLAGNHAHSPELCPTQTGTLFDLLEVGLDGVEYLSELPQHERSSIWPSRDLGTSLPD